MASGKFSQPRNRFTTPEPSRRPQAREDLSETRVLSEDALNTPLTHIPVTAPEAEAPEMTIERALRQMEAETPDLPLPEAYPEEPEDEPTFLDQLMAFCQQNRKLLLVSSCVVVLLLILGAICLVFFGSAMDPYDGKILNNVTIAGINVGGMTRSEAEQIVDRSFSSSFTDNDMLVELPDDTLVLSPDQTGAELDVRAAVKAAYDYGRTGSDAEREAAYQASHTSNHTIGLLPYLDLDTDYIRGVLDDYADRFDTILTQPSYTLEGEMPELGTEKFDENAPCQTLVITMGTPGMAVDIDGIYDDILDAYSFAEFLVEVEAAEPDATPEDPDLEAIYEEVYIAPVDATVNFQTFETIPGSYGYGFDIEAAQRLVEDVGFGQTVEIPMEYIEPEIVDDVLFRDVLGECETPHSTNANRNNNLRLACEALNGVILQPGETLSFNDTVGERTAARGYKPAPAYSGYKLTDALGGGVCQVSSTLYWCSLLADMEIVDRINHGLPVTYMDFGLDATVSWGGPDYKFKNNTNFPIMIQAETTDTHVKMKILGTEERSHYVEMESVITSIVEPDTVYKEYDADSEYYNGQVLEGGSTGYYVKTYKCKYDRETGEQLSREFEVQSIYYATDRVVVKIKEEPTEPSVEPKPTEPEASAPTEGSKPQESTPAESTPVESTPQESKPAESTPAESTPPASQPAESQPAADTTGEGDG